VTFDVVAWQCAWDSSLGISSPNLSLIVLVAIADPDYPTVQGVLVFFGAIVVSASILIDILNAYVDPRIRY